MTVKLVGKRVGLAFLKGRLARIWKPIGEMEVIGMNHGFFVVRFSNSADYNQVFDGGPWMVLGHYLMVQKWEPEFKHAQGELGKVARFGSVCRIFPLSITDLWLIILCTEEQVLIRCWFCYCLIYG